MSKQKKSEDTISATGSAAYSAGPSLYDALDETEREAFGLEAAPVLPFRQQDERSLALRVAGVLSRALEGLEPSSASNANTLGSQTSGTSGLSFTASSASADLQLFLANRSREETDLSGSLEYELDWTEADMALGRSISRLRASARRTSEIESGGLPSGWRTPCAEDGDKGRNSTDSSGALHLQAQADIAGWPTPDSSHHGAMAPQKVLERINSYANGEVKKASNLDDIAVLAGWPTPMAGSPATEDYNEAGNNDFSRKVMGLVPTGWSTPTVQDAENNAGPSQFDRNSHPLNVQAILAGWITPRSTDIGRERVPENNQRPGGGMAALEDQVLLAGWTTPQASEPSTAERPSREETGRTTEYLGRQVLGATSSSSTAATTSGGASRGVLNPAFSLWMQGYHWIWCYCGLLARRSLGLRKSKGESESFEDRATRLSLMLQSGSSASASAGSTENDDA